MTRKDFLDLTKIMNHPAHDPHSHHASVLVLLWSLGELSIAAPKPELNRCSFQVRKTKPFRRCFKPAFCDKSTRWQKLSPVKVFGEIVSVSVFWVILSLFCKSVILCFKKDDYQWYGHWLMISD